MFVGVFERVGLAVLADHHAEIFGDGGGGGVVESPAAHDAAAVRVPLLAEIHHLLHVGGGDAVIAGFPHEDAGAVAVVDDGVAHDFHALLPLAAFNVLLLVAGGADLDDAEFVAGGHILTLGGDVHPTHVVAVAGARAMPCRNRASSPDTPRRGQPIR